MVVLPRTCDRCGAKMMHYGRCTCLPGTLTIHYGDEVVVVDPVDPPEKYAAASKRADELLALIKDSQFEFEMKV